jgi:hypothetical protein
LKPKWPNATGCKSAGYAFEGSSSFISSSGIRSSDKLQWRFFSLSTVLQAQTDRTAAGKMISHFVDYHGGGIMVDKRMHVINSAIGKPTEAINAVV